MLLSDQWSQRDGETAGCSEHLKGESEREVRQVIRSSGMGLRSHRRRTARDARLGDDTQVVGPRHASGPAVKAKVQSFEH